MLKQVICNSIADLDAFITQNLDFFKQKQILLLNGDLGAGKTTFVKRLALALGIHEPITSPSFNYVKTYEGLVHIDLYNYGGDIEEFEDYFENNIVAIEWASKTSFDFGDFLEIKAWINLENQHCFEIV
ncbi:tRNA (adenosine(37)-N6)-threonylcarbamoyltransferase complex ATPase subunit type 1 TsaE [Mycoplasma nasistruthionis]|uniref:tRNA threonylcarbamoyladenosine biosynthesis protein TsaE n=1 Tax=Mycoplasma nasistruthionis TaxID=353852 RepID=A0A4Y6I737_9MOLU|nr:tRNA (adenosine(37)-N6)-threonylcarbamoyltransferase complex ATPase subunit type 1 TsaE [Mycoplasma nasistruthionis]QCZ36717.1 tRNA (adenosine(37)-N6)-threonylcarbamoyltransferase complex ATPase subunit type 1 TsaE [Mycoplasma nasistruthionis]QDF65009.1 tRNA (adenosine(37)-N6)-threonylcarbamoyltransferase complex ATPase subunit type 1 TsaE [Mycoplasma nasistruthionis]